MSGLSGVLQAQQWYAMARHGECFDLGSINDRKALLRGAKSPAEMEAKIRNSGADYTLVPMIAKVDGMMKLTVPSEGLAMVLVKREFCQEVLKR